ncbi:MAG: hypothetical protein HY858_02425 [Candidatus Solibacter usitatus]|nr:hypothetical protein [Candidatus Solibacter usitatus]
MDLKRYFKKVSELESTLPEKDVYIMSLSTADGGVEGVVTQAPKRVACQLVTEGKARLASADEVEMFELEQAEQRLRNEHAEQAKRIQVELVRRPLAG